MSDQVFFVGLDLGQAQDYTAIAVVEKPAHAEEKAVFHLRHIERPRLSTPYPVIVARVKELMESEPLRERAHLIVDATGVGAPVVDLLREAGLSPTPVTITGGDAVAWEKGGYRVPKRDLVSTLQVLFQSGRLLIAEGLPEAPLLVQELLNFKVRINIKTAHDSYEAWREGVHDDLVLATALACWYGNEVHSTFEAYIIQPLNARVTIIG